MNDGQFVYPEKWTYPRTELGCQKRAKLNICTDVSRAFRHDLISGLTNLLNFYYTLKKILCYSFQRKLYNFLNNLNVLQCIVKSKTIALYI